uniref:Putative secreted protein n=1 Tax=Ixodes ricinus TaxID=34613 RepID=A0A6B0UA72_IXORI
MGLFFVMRALFSSLSFSMSSSCLTWRFSSTSSLAFTFFVVSVPSSCSRFRISGSYASGKPISITSATSLSVKAYPAVKSILCRFIIRPR